MATVIITKRDDRLDKICSAEYGSVANREVEQVIDANPGLERQPILLPEGLEITLPDIDTTSSTPIVQQIKLWG
jgi:phage tail protein X